METRDFQNFFSSKSEGLNFEKLNTCLRGSSLGPNFGNRDNPQNVLRTHLTSERKKKKAICQGRIYLDDLSLQEQRFFLLQVIRSIFFCSVIKSDFSLTLQQVHYHFHVACIREFKINRIMTNCYAELLVNDIKIHLPSSCQEELLIVCQENLCIENPLMM